LVKSDINGYYVSDKYNVTYRSISRIWYHIKSDPEWNYSFA